MLALPIIVNMENKIQGNELTIDEVKGEATLSDEEETSLNKEVTPLNEEATPLVDQLPPLDDNKNQYTEDYIKGILLLNGGLAVIYFVSRCKCLIVSVN